MEFQDEWGREADFTIAENFFDVATDFATQLRECTDELELSNFAVGEIVKVLKCDRAIVYQFLPRGDGVIVAESVEKSYKPILGQLIYDPCFNEKMTEPYRLGRVSAIADIDRSSLRPCHVELLKSFRVRANLVVPILTGNRPDANLWGLLIAHQCGAARQWHSLEIKLVRNMAAQVGFVLHELERNAVGRAADETREKEEFRCKEALFFTAMDSSNLGFYVVDNRTDDILYFNRRFCEIWAVEHLENRLQSGELKNNDIIPECIRAIADISAFIESCKPLQNEENRATVEDEIAFADGRTIRRFSSQIRDSEDRYFGRLYLFEDMTGRKQAEITICHQAERERMLNAIARHIRQSLDLDRILQTTVDEVRNFLETDRVIIYRLNPDWSGTVVTESVVSEDLAILNMKITDSYFVKTEGRNYHDGKINNVPDIYTEGFSDCHIELLESLRVRAKLVVPILQGSQTWGLLIAHRCRSPRRWQSFEVELLQQLATQVAIAIRQAELHRELQLKNRELEQLVWVDALTQIANRRHFDRALNHEWWRSLRQKMPLSIILCDIDYFKQYNDTYGHLVGDECLKIVARTLQAVAQRESDLVARYGGEEFAMILPDTDSLGVAQIARSLKEAIHALNLPHVGSQIAPHLTLSMGVATRIPTPDCQPLDLLNEADAALYEAKEGGRDRFFTCRR